MSERLGIRFLVVDDEESIRRLCVTVAQAMGFTCMEAGTGEEALALLDAQPANIILTDLVMPRMSGLEFLERVKRILPRAEVAVMTGHGSVETAVQAMKLGAYDYIAKPFSPLEELRLFLRRMADKIELVEENEFLRERVDMETGMHGIVGTTPKIQDVLRMVARLRDTRTPVLIVGESGTGKELVARAMVAQGPRRDKPFVSINCAALPENLIETELFGHERGAFTDAREARAGHIELAHSGTLFLDEIATLSLPLQSKLLRVLEDRAVTRIGGKNPRKIDFRLITATNEDLEDSVRTGRFREDLYYRINVVPIVLPPLRERPGDVPLLVNHFLHEHCTANKVPLKVIEPEVMAILEEDPWPGNVRELENLVQRFVLMVKGPVIKVQHLPQRILYHSTATQESLLIPDGGVNFDEEIARVEEAYLQAALRRSGGKKVTAAALLHINPQKMKYLCRKYGVHG